MMGELGGMTRVKSSLELLSHTALLKSEIDAQVESGRLSATTGRVSPSESTSGCGLYGNTYSERGLVSPKDISTGTLSLCADHDFSIVGYSSGENLPRDDEVISSEIVDSSPIPTQPAENLAAYLTRCQDTSTNVSFSMISPDSTGYLLKFKPTFMASDEADRREAASCFLPFGNGLSSSLVSTSDLKSSTTSQISSSSSVALESEYAELRKLLIVKDEKIASLEASLVSLEMHVSDLRQLPTGKISQIPIEDMLKLMREYGSELSDTAVPPQKHVVQKASVVRQFRRWNPTFFEHFYYTNGRWVPKLGKKGELERRAEARAVAALASTHHHHHPPIKKPDRL